MQRGRLAAISLVAGGLMVLGAPCAVAAPGVRGGIDAATVAKISYTCFPEQPQNCYTTSRVAVRGWAYNGNTKPSQDVYIGVSGTLHYAYGNWNEPGSFHSGVHPARTSDVADQLAHGLSTRYVGYRFTTQSPVRDFYYIGTVLVCLHARDHGTHQSWRTVGCRHVNAH